MDRTARAARRRTSESLSLCPSVDNLRGAGPPRGPISGQISNGCLKRSRRPSSGSVRSPSALKPAAIRTPTERVVAVLDLRAYEARGWIGSGTPQQQAYRRGGVAAPTLGLEDRVADLTAPAESGGPLNPASPTMVSSHATAWIGHPEAAKNPHFPVSPANSGGILMPRAVSAAATSPAARARGREPSGRPGVRSFVPPSSGLLGAGGEPGGVGVDDFLEHEAVRREHSDPCVAGGMR